VVLARRAARIRVLICVVKRALPTLLVAVLVLTSGALVASAAISRPRADQIVAREASKNRAAARRGAQQALGSVDLPPGAVTSRQRPSGIGRLLRGPGVTPGGYRFVTAHRFWTVPRGPRAILSWLRHRPPAGTTFEGELGGNVGTTLEFETPPGAPGSGDTGGLLFVTPVSRAGGGSVVRADVFEGWEYPRSPRVRIPSGSRFLRLVVAPGPGGLHEVNENGEGEEPPPPRSISTQDPALIARLVRIVNRQPADQEYELASCGPEGLASEYHLFTFVFKKSRRGSVVARVSQEKPIGLCSPLKLRVGPRGPYALEGGWKVLHAARGLIRRAHR
jgi:hypothetical protein